MFEMLHAVISWTTFVLNVIGSLIVLWGIMLALFEFLRKELLNRNELIPLNEAIRLKLGSYLILALEIFIASDIIKTVITPTWESLGILGAIVVIRTVLSYFLTQDLKKAQ